LQAEAAAEAKITLESLLREAAEIQTAAISAKQSRTRKGGARARIH
jgi:hypothetical protein